MLPMPSLFDDRLGYGAGDGRLVALDEHRTHATIEDSTILSVKNVNPDIQVRPRDPLVVRQAREFVASARRHGDRRSEILELVEGLLGGQRAQQLTGHPSTGIGRPCDRPTCRSG